MLFLIYYQMWLKHCLHVISDLKLSVSTVSGVTSVKNSNVNILHSFYIFFFNIQNTPSSIKAVLFWLGLHYSQLFFYFFCSVHETILISVCHRRKPTKDNTVTKRIWACRSYNGHISIEQLSNKMSNPKILGWIWLVLGLFFNTEYDLGS